MLSSRDGMKGMDMTKFDSLKENAFDIEFIRQMIRITRERW